MEKQTGGGLFLLFSILLCIVSCTPESCLDETESFVKASMYSFTTQKPLPPDSLTLYGVNMDTMKLYNKELKIPVIRLPLNASADKCVFIIKINGISDTLEFNYVSYPHLLSKECGYTFYHSIELPVYSTHAIKSIEVFRNTITTVNEENIRIFF